MTSLSTKLDARERAQYQARGYHFPLRAYSVEEASALAERFLLHWQHYSEQLTPLLPRERVAFSVENHLFLRWVYEIVTNPRILDAVESVLGPNVMVWSSQWFPKFPHDKAFVSWHQDATYWGLSSPDVMTVWVAFTPANLLNGCMKYIPGSHLAQLEHRDTFDKANLLSRGQEIAVEVDAGKAVTLELQPGEMSLHHVRLVHGSDRNPSGRRRIGFAIRYLPTHVRQVVGSSDSATLVRGVDAFGNFAPERPPELDYSQAARAYHGSVLNRANQVLYRGTDRAPA